MRVLVVIIVFTVSCVRPMAGPFTSLKGNWLTTWTYDVTNSLRFYLKVTNPGTPTTSGTATFDSLDTGANNLPVSTLSNNPPYVRIVTTAGYIFEGTNDAGFTRMDGVWTDGVSSWPMEWLRNPSVDEMLARTFSNSYGNLPYRLFVPAGYDSGLKYPLVLFMHGSGERGSDDRLQITGQSGALAFTFNENQARQPCFLLAPQCPSGGSWTDTARRSQVPGLIAALKSEFSIDADRVYATGLSLGGIGTWDLLSRNPTLFAAGIPMSGNTSASASTFFQIPVWDFHAANDSTVAVSGSRNVISAMRALGGTPIYTEYTSGGHVIWSAAYATPLLFDWVMAQRRGVPTVRPPFARIQTPTDQTNYTTAASSLPLAGDAADETARITAVSWSNTRGGSGTALGTTEWSIPAVPLQNGVNLVTVLATGTAWVSGYGGTTTFNDSIRITRVSPPSITMTPTNGSLRLEWTGGVAPFRLQTRTDVATPGWESQDLDTNRSVLVDLTNGARFFRVQSQ